MYSYFLLELVDLALELAALLDDRLVLRLDRVRYSKTSKKRSC